MVESSVRKNLKAIKNTKRPSSKNWRTLVTLIIRRLSSNMKQQNFRYVQKMQPCSVPKEKKEICNGILEWNSKSTNRNLVICYMFRVSFTECVEDKFFFFIEEGAPNRVCLTRHSIEKLLNEWNKVFFRVRRGCKRGSN